MAQNPLSLLDVPIIQAPMAGDPNTVALVVAASEAGALGSYGAALTAPDGIRDAVREIRAKTAKPFALNLFTGGSRDTTAAEWNTAKAALAPVYKELGLNAPDAPPVPAYTLDDQIAAVIEARPAVFSFTFGMPSREVIETCRKQGIATVGTATTLAEVDAMDDLGVDAICIQGAEAGGHRGTFIGAFENAMIPTMTLLTAAVARTKRPLLAAGGLMNSEDVAAVLRAGAMAAQLGTVFLTTTEAGTNATSRRLLLSGGGETAVTSAYSGRPARGLRNAFMDRMTGQPTAAHPAHRALTAQIRALGVRQNDPAYVQTWAGTGNAACRAASTAEIVAGLINRL